MSGPNCLHQQQTSPQPSSLQPPRHSPKQPSCPPPQPICPPQQPPSPKHPTLVQEESTVEYSINQEQELTLQDKVVLSGMSKGKVNIKTEKRHVCEECGLASSSSSNHKKHMLVHSGKRPFMCHYCPKAFKQQQHLTTHIRTHTGERPYKCDQCNSRFAQRACLSMHLKRHTGIKRHVCNICEKSFYENSQLKLHMRFHTGEKPYVCETCGQTCSSSTRLKYHQMIHTGEKRFQCEVCDTWFRENVTLQKHRSVHVNVGPFPCPDCGQEFSRLAGLALHRKVHDKKNDFLYVPTKVESKSVTTGTISTKQISDKMKEHEHLRTNSNKITTGITGMSTKSLKLKQAITSGKTAGGSFHSNLSKETPSYSLPVETKSDCSSAFSSQKVKEMSSKNPMNNVGMDQVMDALANGKMMITKDDNGKQLIIVLPPSLIDGKFTLRPETQQDLRLSSESNQMSNPSSNVSRNVGDFSKGESSGHLDITNDAEKSQDTILHHGSDSDDMAVEFHEDVSTEELITAEIREHVPKVDNVRDYADSVEVGNEIKGSLEGYSRGTKGAEKKLKGGKEAESDSPSLILWNADLENATNEVTYIIDEGGSNSIMIQSQEVSAENAPLKQRQKRKGKVEGNKRKRTKTDSDLPVRVTIKSKLVAEKKVKVKRNYDCTVCGKACKKSSTYIAHMRYHSGERPYSCDFCRQNFKQISHLRTHVRIHTGERPFVCNICGYAFTQSSRLTSHMKTKHAEGRKEVRRKEKPAKDYKHRNFYCKICKKTFIDECYRIEHMKKHIESVQTLSCKICGVQYKCKSSLKKHMMKHSDNQSVCEVCGRSFPDLISLHLHRVDYHQINEQYQISDQCQINNNNQINDHPQINISHHNHHQNPAGNTTSDMCISVKIGESEDFLVINPSMKSIPNEGESECIRPSTIVCPKKGGSHIRIKNATIDIVETCDNLVTHKVIQVTEECGLIRSEVLTKVDACEAKLDEEVELRAGEGNESHSKKENDVSDRETRKENGMLQTKHKGGRSRVKVKEGTEKLCTSFINASGSKIWVCRVCKKHFLQSSNLYSHLRVHTGERPYRCNLCSKGFKQITHLKDHMTIHTGNMPYKCSDCDFEFSQRAAVKRHIKRMHQNKAVVLKNTNPTGRVKKGRISSRRKRRSSDKDGGHDSGFTCICKAVFDSADLLSEHLEICQSEITDTISLTELETGVLSDDLNVDTNRSSKKRPKQRNKDSKRNCNDSTGNYTNYTCKICQATCDNLVSFKLHLASHGSDSGEMCEDCGLVFKRASALRAHQNIKHGRTDERYKEYSVSVEAEIKEEISCGETDTEYTDSDNENYVPVKRSEKTTYNECDIQKRGCSTRRLREQQQQKGNSPDDLDNIQDKSNTRARKVSKNNVGVLRSLSPVKRKSSTGSDMVEKINNKPRTSGTSANERGKYACVICEKVFNRLSKLKNHETMWCTGNDLVQDRSKLNVTSDFEADMEENTVRFENSSSDEDNDAQTNRQCLKRTTQAVDSDSTATTVKAEHVERSVTSPIEDNIEQEPAKFNRKVQMIDVAQIKMEIEVTTQKTPATKTSSKQEKAKSKTSAKMEVYCKICRKLFTQPQSYKVHMAAHQDLRPYKCDVCPAAFNQKSHLTSHCRRHTGERPYQCHLCPRAFTQQHCLKQHIKKLHPD